MYLQIVMEYCGGGSVADLMNITDEPLEEYQIAYICKEALKVISSSFGLTIQVILANWMALVGICRNVRIKLIYDLNMTMPAHVITNFINIRRYGQGSFDLKKIAEFLYISLLLVQLKDENYLFHVGFVVLALNFQGT